MLLILAHWSQK